VDPHQAVKPGPLLTEYREARAAWQAFDIEADRRVARALVALDRSNEPIPYDIYPRRHIMHPAYIYAPQPDDIGPPPEPAPAPPEAERFVEITYMDEEVLRLRRSDAAADAAHNKATS